jgi:3-hydroxyacyl-CoA dehydrogenase / enoyl-CoA hydratase / 3-hydroxybutyryl-CoA epimerase
VVEDADLLDAGMIFGTGFAPFRGGPLHYLDSRKEDKNTTAADKEQSR